MGITRFELENQAIARRTAVALEGIAQSLEKLLPYLDLLKSVSDADNALAAGETRSMGAVLADMEAQHDTQDPLKEQ